MVDIGLQTLLHHLTATGEAPYDPMALADYLYGTGQSLFPKHISQVSGAKRRRRNVTDTMASITGMEDVPPDVESVASSGLISPVTGYMDHPFTTLHDKMIRSLDPSGMTTPLFSSGAEARVMHEDPLGNIEFTVDYKRLRDLERLHEQNTKSFEEYYSDLGKEKAKNAELVSARRLKDYIDALSTAAFMDENRQRYLIASIEKGIPTLTPIQSTRELKKRIGLAKAARLARDTEAGAFLRYEDDPSYFVLRTRKNEANTSRVRLKQWLIEHSKLVDLYDVVTPFSNAPTRELPDIDFAW